MLISGATVDKKRGYSSSPSSSTPKSGISLLISQTVFQAQIFSKFMLMGHFGPNKNTSKLVQAVATAPGPKIIPPCLMLQVQHQILRSHGNEIPYYQPKSHKTHKSSKRIPRTCNARLGFVPNKRFGHIVVGQARVYFIDGCWACICT